ncbi:ABC transporter substrate-binding protein [Bifidobacterium ramosum]|uniref:ABC transporter substrate-binding protein n=1 Tax=Bifidobacterium ramosum TaxID=1798158 RepID=A0A6L4WXK1_9BIFI|nr:ABC transporter substrate-binding protein [Bifidobacterium ramosum]KAB8286754.1 ABC transporter substrate-binding protein [Bifidobacterium ramosum]NEG72760.1 ABC transporter substrate-binding protein [Bifidobacterium ramosum]
MNRISKAAKATALIAALTLAMSGCGASSSNTKTTSSESYDKTAVITTNGSEPLNPLTPMQSVESGGAKVATQLFAGLVTYDKDGKPVLDAAKSITPNDDSTVWTITLKDGWTFTNGEKMTSDSFINAWNYTAKLSNGLQAASYFSNIKGYSDSTDSDLTGLEKKDDLTFTVTLNKPESDFLMRLGYVAFAPVPSVAFKDMKSFGEHPIGNGPYKMAGDNAWQHDSKIELVANPDYKGVRKPKNGGITFTLYTSLNSAYADVQSDNLDVLDTIPDSAITSVAKDFPDHSVNQPAAIFQSISIPYYLKHWSGEEGALRRKAISYAINRDTIVKKIFNNTRTAATDFSSPAVDGYTKSLKGSEVLTYNKEKAQELWKQANEISDYGDETFYIAYNSDGGHKTWVDAVCNSIKNTLGIKAQGDPYPTFSASLEDRLDSKLKGAIRAGWQADWPSLFNFLNENYRTGASSDLEGYSNPKFDALIDEGAASTSSDDAIKKFQQAEEILLEDLPAVPLWYQNVDGVWASKVSNVTFGWDSVPMYYQITKQK